MKLGRAWLAVLICDVVGEALGGTFSLIVIRGSKWLEPLRRNRPLVIAGVVQTLLTAVVIAMEMTDNQGLLLPTMATAFLAYLVSRMIHPEPIYRVLAKEFLERVNKTPEAVDGTNPEAHKDKDVVNRDRVV